jgi:predicted small lipoprotein YifL
VTASCRVGVSHLVALAFFAGALAACGVKGDLERPPAASYAEPTAKSEQPKSSTSTTSGKVFTEESRVERVPAYSILPKSQPEEWEKQKLKSRDTQAKQAPKKSGEPTEPDRPFILDGLL